MASRRSSETVSPLPGRDSRDSTCRLVPQLFEAPKGLHYEKNGPFLVVGKPPDPVLHTVPNTPGSFLDTGGNQPSRQQLMCHGGNSNNRGDGGWEPWRQYQGISVSNGGPVTSCPPVIRSCAGAEPGKGCNGVPSSGPLCFTGHAIRFTEPLGSPRTG